MSGFDNSPEMSVEESFSVNVESSMEPLNLYEKQLKRAYQLGLLHGINAQSMAQVESDVMAFDDYGWEL